MSDKYSPVKLASNKLLENQSFIIPIEIFGQLQKNGFDYTEEYITQTMDEFVLEGLFDNPYNIVKIYFKPW